MNTEYIDLSNALLGDVSSSSNDKCTWHATEPGFFCLSDARHVKFYAAEVWKNGGHLTLFDGFGRAIFKLPSVFTGSFQLDGYAAQGLYARVGANNNVCPHITISFQELDIA